MNREALTQLRDYIAALPEEKFDYQHFFGDGNVMSRWWRGEMPPCGTAGCVAGHAVILFGLTAPKAGLPSQIAGKFLGLSHGDEDALFFAAVIVASKDDAVRRMDYLLEHETLAGYDFSGESWWKMRATQPQAYLEALEQSQRPLPPRPASASPETPSQTLPVPAPRMGSSSTGGYAVRSIHLLSGQPAESLLTES